MNINKNDYEKFLKDISGGQDISSIPETLEETEQEKELGLFVYMCYVVSGMNPAWEITTEKWNELIKFGMVTSKTTKEGINYYITDKAIEYVEGVDRDYANKVSLYKKDKLLRTDRNNVKKFVNDIIG